MKEQSEKQEVKPRGLLFTLDPDYVPEPKSPQALLLEVIEEVAKKGLSGGATKTVH